MKLGALLSSGKDSVYALYLAQKEHDIECLISIESQNPDSYMYHTPNIHMVELQSAALGIPLIKETTMGEKEKELKALKKVLEKARKKYSIEGVVTGALFSEYQKSRIERICKELGVEVVNPLWHMEQAKEVKAVIDAGFEFVFTKVAAYGLDKSWLNKKIGYEQLERLKKLNEKVGFNVAGEGGEFESLVLDGPIFSKRIKIVDFEVVGGKNTAEMFIKDAVLLEK